MRLSEERVHEASDTLLRRLANELGVEHAALRRHTRYYQSFLPPNAAPPRAGDPRAGQPEWSREWCRPQPGQLLQALADHRCAPHHALMVSADERDEDAAQAAGVASIRCMHLLGFTPASHLVTPNGSARRGSRGAQAPDAFVVGV